MPSSCLKSRILLDMAAYLGTKLRMTKNILDRAASTDFVEI